MQKVFLKNVWTTLNKYLCNEELKEHMGKNV